MTHLPGYAAFFVGALALSWHCVGMCGPFVLAVAGKDRWRGLSRQAAYHAGKTSTYLLLGLAAALLGRTVERHASQAFPVQGMLSWLAGIVLLLVGLQLLGLFRWAGGLDRLLSGHRWSGLCGRFIPSGSHSGAAALGLLNGFMPCPLVIAALVKSAETSASPGGSLLAGLGYVVALSLATVPVLLVLAGGGSWLRSALAFKPVRAVGGVAILALALVAFLRPLPIVHRWMGHDHAQHASADSADPGPHEHPHHH